MRPFLNEWTSVASVARDEIFIVTGTSVPGRLYHVNEFSMHKRPPGGSSHMETVIVRVFMVWDMRRR